MNTTDFIFIVDKDRENQRKGFSFAWISPKEHFDKTGYLQDNIRTHHILKHYPNFLGVDDMESHFKFRLSRQAMIRHLTFLGFTRKDS